MTLMIDGPMITRFIENQEEFNKFLDEKLENVKQNNDENHPTSEKYRDEYRDMLMAIAKGIGNTPVNVMVEEGSFLTKAYGVEVSRIRREEEEERKKIIAKEKENHYLNNNGDNNNKVEIIVPKNKVLKKKSSFNLMNFCACSGKQFVKDG